MTKHELRLGTLILSTVVTICIFFSVLSENNFIGIVMNLIFLILINKRKELHVQMLPSLFVLDVYNICQNVE